MRSFLRTSAILAAIGVVAAICIVGFGLYNVSARQGHLPGISWALHTTYRNAVKLRAPDAEDVPDISSPSLIDLGRYHYENACAFCHSLPDEARSKTALSMLPAPPRIDEAVEHWEPQHMFWIVKNGVKMSGMPAWPSEQRDDDVWAVVAYLNAIKNGQTFSGDERPLFRENGTRAAMLYRDSCGSCHGPAGFAEGNVFIPRLDALSQEYIAATLHAYRTDQRQSGIMQHAASALSQEEIAGLAAYISTNTEAGQSTYDISNLDPLIIERGRSLAQGGGQNQSVPSCAACHGPAASRKSPRFPALSGQSYEFIFNQLKLWKAETRGGTDRAKLMHEVVPNLSVEDMKAIAEYYASLAPGRQTGP